MRRFHAAAAQRQQLSRHRLPRRLAAACRLRCCCSQGSALWRVSMQNTTRAPCTRSSAGAAVRPARRARHAHPPRRHARPHPRLLRSVARPPPLPPGCCGTAAAPVAHVELLPLSCRRGLSPLLTQLLTLSPPSHTRTPRAPRSNASAGTNQTRFGVMVLGVYSMSNPLLHIAKVCNQLSLGPLKMGGFAAFALVFFVSRIILVPLSILKPALFDSRWGGWIGGCARERPAWRMHPRSVLRRLDSRASPTAPPPTPLSNALLAPVPSPLQARHPARVRRLCAHVVALQLPAGPALPHAAPLVPGHPPRARVRCSGCHQHSLLLGCCCCCCCSGCRCSVEPALLPSCSSLTPRSAPPRPLSSAAPPCTGAWPSTARRPPPT